MAFANPFQYGLAGLLGGANTFSAAAPQNNIQVPTQNYAPGITQAQQAALQGNAQGNATAGQQGALAQRLLAMANGTGPSLAQNQLQQATQSNITQQAGLMASQRGLNPGLAARQIAEQGAAANQGAAAQSAQLRLQEQLGATGQLAGALGQQRAQDIGQQQANTGLFGAQAGAQQAQNSLAEQQAAQNAALQLGGQQIAAGVAGQNSATDAAIAGGLLGGLGSVAAGPLSGALATALKPTPAPQTYQGNQPGVSPPLVSQPLAHGGMVFNYAAGALVPGHAPVAGDSPQNDKVKALLSPGEVVVPRSVVNAPDAPVKAAQFVAHAKAGAMPDAVDDPARVQEFMDHMQSDADNKHPLLRIAELEARIKALEPKKRGKKAA